MSALPIRARLTLAFALLMAALLGGTGLFVYARVRGNLDSSIARSLATRATDVAALARQSDTALRESASKRSSGPAIAQLLSRSGRVIDSAPALARTRLLSARARQLGFARGEVAGQAQLEGVGHARLLARRISAQDQQLLVVVGEPLAGRDRTLAGLREELLLGGPAA
ncbi:MAG TPA: hypothetical protein VNZ05_07830, partial [Solirubrobacteraceae bacterium]|nr:hypothetical protein [Solirubrobacteraceae bacterium]